MEKRFEEAVKRGYVRYSDFGAAGDGKHDDYPAIFEAHKFANQHGLDVFADEGAVYYTHVFEKPVIIKTNTDFTGAKFIIDDTGNEVFDHFNVPLFLIDRDNEAKIYSADDIKNLFGEVSIKAGDTVIPWLKGKLGAKSLIRFTNENHRDFIRFGSNVNSGNPRTDCLLIDTDGAIDPDTPVAFAFDEVTKMEIYETDDKPITVKGGYFETICCRVVEQTGYENKWRGYYRKFKIIRANTTVKDMTHRILGEPDIPNTGYGRSEDGKLRQSYPYYGFVFFTGTYNCRAENLALNAHTTYYEDKTTSDKPVPMGSYDLVIEYSSHIYCENITNCVDINDTRYWGIMSSNGAKNMEFKNCSMSRFDAHRGFWNARLIGCEFGQTINVIGGGKLEIIDTVRTAGASFVALRGDYGATFNGDIVIKNCRFDGKKKYRGVSDNSYHKDALYIVHSGYSYNKEKYLEWDFGYTCYMPQNIYIENLTTSLPDSTYVFSAIGDAAFDSAISNQYVITKGVYYKDMTALGNCPVEECTFLAKVPSKKY